MKKMVIPILVLFLLPLPVWGATISVCSSGCNYTDIQSAYNSANPGDVVEVRDSRTYAGGISMNKSGTSTSPITLKAGSGSAPTISMSGGWLNGAVMIGGNWNVLKGFNIGPVNSGNGVFVYGQRNVIENCTIKDIHTSEMASGQAGEGVLLAGGKYNIIRNNYLGNAGHASIGLYDVGSYSGTHYNQILNNTIVNYYGTGICLTRGNSNYNLIEGNDISRTGTLTNYSGKTGIQITGSSNNTVRKNVIHDTYYKALQINCYNSADGTRAIGNYIYNNTFFNIGTKSNDPGNMGLYIGVAGGGPYTITGNKFYNNIIAKVGNTIQELTGVAGSPAPAWAYYNVAEYDSGDSESQVIANDWNGNVLKNNCIRPYYGGAYQTGYNFAVYYRNSNGGYVMGASATGINGKGSMSGNIASDPMFNSENTSQANWWFLRSGSTLVDAGIVVIDPNAATGGWSQMTYSGARPDIGAYEAGGSGGTTPTAPSAPRNLRIVQ